MENKIEQYKSIYMEEMNLNYLNMTKEDYILMQMTIESCLNDNISMTKKEFKNFIKKVIKNNTLMKGIKANIRGEDSE